MQSVIFGLVLAIAILAPLLYFLHQEFQKLRAPQEEQGMKMMLQLIGELRREVSEGHGKNREALDKKLQDMIGMLQKNQSHSTLTMQEQFKQSAAIVQEVTKNLTELQATNKQVVGFAEQMKSLENILKSPKQRGILGEYALETLLSNQLHGNYQMQYKMPNGEIVDAVIFFNQLIIPIDSKFSLENYNKMVEESDEGKREELERTFKADVKKRIDETSKYIRPSDGTTEFAFMFIPAEGVYYNLTVTSVGSGNVNTRNLMEYAFEKRVILVSPSSFFAYLQTVLQGMKAMEMGENVSKTLQGIEVLGKHVKAYEEYMHKLGRHLDTTVNTYNSASKEFKKIDKDVYKLTDGKSGGTIEALLVDGVAEESN